MQWLRRGSTLFVAVLFAFGAAACGERAETQADAEPGVVAGTEAPGAELLQRDDEFIAAWNSTNPEAVADFYTEDATVTTDAGSFTGRQQITDEWLQNVVPALQSVQVQDVAWRQDGENYVATGRYNLQMTTAEGEQITDAGTFEDTWTQDNGTWRVRSMRLQSDNPQVWQTPTEG